MKCHRCLSVLCSPNTRGKHLQKQPLHWIWLDLAESCTHLSLARVHSVRKLAGGLVDEELRVQKRPGASSRGGHVAPGWGRRKEAGGRGHGRGQRGLASLGGGTGGSRGSGGQITSMVPVEWRGGHRASGSPVTTPIRPDRTLTQVSVGLVLHTREVSLWNHIFSWTYTLGENLKSVNIHRLVRS